MRQSGKIETLILVFISVFIFSILMGCSDKSSDPTNKPDDEPKVTLSVTDQAILEKSNVFGFRLFQAIADANQGDDIFISPLSVSIALGMAYNGAAGDTRDSIQNLLDLSGLTQDELNESYKTLSDYLVNLDPDVVMQIANSNWLKDGLIFKKEFIDYNRDYFDAEVKSVDFLDPATLTQINNWVSDKTHGKITTILNELDPLTVLILINAIYFKGTWTYQFDPEDTYDEVFYSENGPNSTADYMNAKMEIDYLNNDNFQSINLPYSNGDYVMTLFLPKGAMTTDQLIDQFTQENFDLWMAQYEVEEVNVFLPKFKMELKYTLNNILTDLGMGIAFSPMAADFSNIIEDIDLFISKVVHKSFIEVNEEGTEAAAVTAIVFETTSIPQEIAFMANKPFVFVIRDVQSSALLFMGKVNQPEN